MPFCEVRNNGIKLFYRTYGRGPVKVLLIIGEYSHSWFSLVGFRGIEYAGRFGLIVLDLGWGRWAGLAGTHESWGPQIRGLTRTDVPNDSDSAAVEGGADNESGGDSSGIEVCAFDNRGMGRSSIPTKKSSYT